MNAWVVKPQPQVQVVQNPVERPIAINLDQWTVSNVTPLPQAQVAPKVEQVPFSHQQVRAARRIQQKFNQAVRNLGRGLKRKSAEYLDEY